MHARADLDPSARDRAFESLYRRYVKDVYRYTLAVLRNPADAEDITQTTFLNAYRAFKRGEEPLKPQHWLIKIAHNACRTRYLRATRRPLEVPLEESLDQLAVPSDEIPNVKAVLNALAMLPFNQRSALAMRELEGRSYHEIAQTLEVSVAAVETLIFRARRALRVKRSSLRALATLPVPASLSSFSAGTAAVGGGPALGALLLKAALAVGVGIGAGMAGTTVQATVLGSDPVLAPNRAAAPTESVTVAPSATASPGVGAARPGTAGGPESWSVVERRRERPIGEPQGKPAHPAPGPSGSAAPSGPAGGEPAGSAANPASPVQPTEAVEELLAAPSAGVPAVPHPATPPVGALPPSPPPLPAVPPLPLPPPLPPSPPLP